MSVKGKATISRNKGINIDDITYYPSKDMLLVEIEAKKNK